MPPIPKYRDLAPFLYRVRNFLLGRKHKTNNRYADTMAPRTQPPPQIPDGPPRNLHQVYYFTRDPRRMVKPPIDLIEKQKRQIAAKAKAQEEAAAKAKAAKAAAAAPPQPKAVAAGAPPPPPQPKEDAKQLAKIQKDCVDNVKRKRGTCKMGILPTPGKMHSWD